MRCFCSEIKSTKKNDKESDFENGECSDDEEVQYAYHAYTAGQRVYRGSKIKFNMYEDDVVEMDLYGKIQGDLSQREWWGHPTP
jgi:hypothetical protein